MAQLPTTGPTAYWVQFPVEAFAGSMIHLPLHCLEALAISSALACTQLIYYIYGFSMVSKLYVFLYCIGPAPEKYWEMLAESRREALEESLQENEMVCAAPSCKLLSSCQCKISDVGVLI